jgi:hypothetical protein
MMHYGNFTLDARPLGVDPITGVGQPQQQSEFHEEFLAICQAQIWDDTNTKTMNCRYTIDIPAILILPRQHEIDEDTNEMHKRGRKKERTPKAAARRRAPRVQRTPKWRG